MYTSGASGKPAAPLPPNVVANSGGSTVNVPTMEPPSYASTMQAKAKAQRIHPPLPPPPYTDDAHPSYAHPPIQRKYSPAVGGGTNDCCRSDSPLSSSSGDGRNLYPDNGAPPLPPTGEYFLVKTRKLIDNYKCLLQLPLQSKLTQILT